MRAVIQRVSQAEVQVEGRTVGRIGRGLCVFVCIERQDGEGHVDRAVRRISGVRCFPDGAGKMNLDLAAVSGAMLVVSQFTLAADLRRGRRPGFDAAAPPPRAAALYRRFVEGVSRAGIPVATGEFGAHMKVVLTNEGPVTFQYEDRAAS